MKKSMGQRMDECCEEAIEAGYMDEAMMKRHGFGWFARWFFTFGLKRSRDWEYWYYDPATGIELMFDVMKDKPVGFLKERKRFELRWCPRGERR